jgi:uncharacterized protein
MLTWTYVKRVGVISDTHGLLRPEAIRAMKGSDLIIHAGDIGSERILQTIAPVIAVRGNNDREAWARKIPETRVIEVEHHRIFLLHNLREIDLHPKPDRMDVVISGHSHQRRITCAEGILYLNPGSFEP